MTQTKSKKDLIDEFEIMESTEESARDLYLRICEDSHVRQSEFKQIFARIAEDEQHHMELVRKIINIIQNTL